MRLLLRIRQSKCTGLEDEKCSKKAKEGKKKLPNKVKIYRRIIAIHMFLFLAIYTLNISV